MTQDSMFRELEAEGVGKTSQASGRTEDWTLEPWTASPGYDP